MVNMSVVLNQGEWDDTSSQILLQIIGCKSVLKLRLRKQF